MGLYAFLSGQFPLIKVAGANIGLALTFFLHFFRVLAGLEGDALIGFEQTLVGVHVLLDHFFLCTFVAQVINQELTLTRSLKVALDKVFSGKLYRY